MNSRELYNYLRGLPKQLYADHTALLAYEVPQFLQILGYSGSIIFFEFLMSLEDRLTADAVVAEDRTKSPRIVVEVKTWRAMFDNIQGAWKQTRQRYERFLTSDDHFLVLFSPKVLGIADSSKPRLYDLTQLKEDQASEIYSWLHSRRPAAKEMSETSDVATPRAHA